MTTNIPILEEFKEEKIVTVVADDLEIKGTIKFKTSVMLKGICEGEIISEGLLVVGPTAKVTATITTKTLISYGEINGNVTASEQCMLKSTASHNGNLKTPFLSIENGAYFNGDAIMERKEQETVPEVTETPEVAEETPMSAGQPEGPQTSDAPDDTAKSYVFGRDKKRHDKVVSIDGSAVVGDTNFSTDDMPK